MTADRTEILPEVSGPLPAGNHKRAECGSNTTAISMESDTCQAPTAFHDQSIDANEGKWE